MFDFEFPETDFFTLVACKNCGWQGGVGELVDDPSGWDELRYCPNAERRTLNTEISKCTLTVLDIIME